MRRGSALLWSTTAIAAAFAISSPASAQDQPPPDPNATAQENPAQPTQNADAPTSGETIVVTGRNIARAQRLFELLDKAGVMATPLSETPRKPPLLFE